MSATLCRLFLRKLKDTLKIPVLALVDSDPYGLKILSVFMKGELSHDNPSHNCTLNQLAYSICDFGVKQN